LSGLATVATGDSSGAAAFSARATLAVAGIGNATALPTEATGGGGSGAHLQAAYTTKLRYLGYQPPTGRVYTIFYTTGILVPQVLTTVVTTGTRVAP
jgi:hypothetical protein